MNITKTTKATGKPQCYVQDGHGGHWSNLFKFAKKLESDDQIRYLKTKKKKKKKKKKNRVREKFRECHNHKPQPFPDTKRKRKPTKLNKHKSNKRTKSTKISSLFPKRGYRNAKRTEKHKNKITQGKT